MPLSSRTQAVFRGGRTTLNPSRLPRPIPARSTIASSGIDGSNELDLPKIENNLPNSPISGIRLHESPYLTEPEIFYISYESWLVGAIGVKNTRPYVIFADFQPDVEPELKPVHRWFNDRDRAYLLSLIDSRRILSSAQSSMRLLALESI